MLKSRPAETLAQNDAEPAGFVAVIDGSGTGLRALGPALALAEWFDRPCHVLEVTAGVDDHDTSFAVAFQLEAVGLEDHDVVVVAKSNLDAALFGIISRGHTIVTSAYGAWARDGRLRGVLSGLVSHHAPAVIGVGPNVPPDWRPDENSPLLVCVDATEHAHHIADKIDRFIVPERSRVLVAHIEVEEPPNSKVAGFVASQIHERYGIAAASTSLPDHSAPASIAILASRLQSQLVVTHSWHRPRVGEPVIASTSLSAVAHAPCPVVILGDTECEGSEA